MTVVLHMTTIIRKLVKWFYLLFAVAAICLALMVQAGRSFSPLLGNHPKEVSDYLSRQLKAQVSIKSLSAEWDGLKPTVDLRDLRISSQSGQPILGLQQAQMRVDLLSSFLHARLVWSSLTLGKVEMDFAQADDGFWHLSGLSQATKADEPRADLDPLIDMSLLSRRIEFNQSQLNLHFASGDKTSLYAPLLRMENLKDFHRLTLQVDVNNQPKSLFLVMEGTGDPRKRESFTSNGFVQLNKFPTSEPIAAVTALLLHGIKAEVHSEGSLDARLWFSSRPQHQGFDVVGNLGVQRLSVPVMTQKLALDSFKTDLVGHWLYSGNWQLALQNLGAKVNQQHLEKVNFAVSAADFEAPVILHMQHLNLNHLSQTLDSAGILGEAHLRDIIRQLSLQGELRNVEVAIPRQDPKEWEVTANLQQVGVNAWRGVPALRKVDGYLHAGQRGGFVDIDSRNGFSMHYHPTYNAPMEYQQAKGQVAWWLQPENNQIYVNSGALEFINGDEYAKGYMWLALPWKHNTGDVDLYLQIGARHLNASLYNKYTPAVIPPSLLNWLEASIGPHNTGFVNQVGFTYRGTLNNTSHAAHSHQLFLDVSHAQLKYHPEWPALEAMDGRLLVSDDDVFASVDKARLFDSQVSDSYINVSPNPDGKGSLLNLTGQVSGPASDGLRVLRETMLRRYVGANMDSWKLDGHLQTQLNLAVPLAADGSGAAQQVDVDIDAPNFEMGHLKLALQNLQGHIQFNQETGLSSEGLRATLFDEPVTALLSTKKQGESSQTLVNFSGEVDSDNLAKWSQRPEALFMQGKIPYRAQVELNHSVAAAKGDEPFALVTVDSQLNGVKVDLPAPYGKTAASEAPLSFRMALHERTSLIHVSYGANLKTLLLLDAASNKLINANVALGEEAKLSETPQFLVSGKLPTLDIEPLKKVLQRYQNYTARLAPPVTQEQQAAVDAAPSALVAGLPFKATITLAHYEVGPLDLKDVAVMASPTPSAWDVHFTNPVTSGEVLLPNDVTQPVRIDLDHLHLTSNLLGIQPDLPTNPANPGEVVPRGPSVDPRALPLANVTVKALFMDDKNYGNWSLQIRPNAQGVVFDDIHGSVRGVKVGGLDTEVKGARLQWLLDEAGATTHFTGVLSSTNISEVLREWQKPDSLESKSARFGVDVAWIGDPQDFELKKLSGNMDIALEKGRFKRSPAGGSDGFLRLMAILNFDSLARRLRLDFSDLYKSGLAYDKINGKVNFVPGTMTFTEPLVVLTPSSRLQLAGKLDLEHEKINGRLIATLPVVGNFTFFTALVTGLPAAAGIYVVSKLFKKQVDQATSIGYTIRGGWDDPKMSFDRLFESQDSLLNNASKSEAEKSKYRHPKGVAPDSSDQ